MARYSVAATKDRLSSLIDKAMAGEEVVITRHGLPVVEMRATGADASAANRAAMADLRAFRASLPVGSISTSDLVRSMRDEGN
jgi:antitoxin (DNA-binding transcriptional repressor) of toxin-antitoxin stability system